MLLASASIRSKACCALRARVLSLTFVLAIFVSTPTEASRHKRTVVDQAVQEVEDEAATSLTQVPQDLEICFSPDEHCDRKIVKFVDSAVTSLDIAIYDVNLGMLVNHIIKKSKQIPVRMVVDRGQAKTEHSAVPRLLEAGVKIKFGSQRGIMHNKFVIVDGKMMETGSFNQTNGASFYNNENQLYISNPKVLDRYKKRFEWLWLNGKLNRH